MKKKSYNEKKDPKQKFKFTSYHAAKKKKKTFYFINDFTFTNLGLIKKKKKNK